MTRVVDAGSREFRGVIIRRSVPGKDVDLRIAKSVDVILSPTSYPWRPKETPYSAGSYCVSSPVQREQTPPLPISAMPPR